MSKAQEFAEKAHDGQTYDSHLYTYHLQSVVDTLGDLARRGGFVTPEMYDAAWLHDVLEDTPIHIYDLEYTFDYHVAHIVDAVTDKPGNYTRYERKRLTMPYIRWKGGYEAVVVKVCDRIANTEYSSTHSVRKYKMYQGEYDEFRRHLYRAGEAEYLWTRLDRATRQVAVNVVE